MNLFLQILFWSSALAMVHTYIFYPFILKYLVDDEKLLTPEYYNDDEAPEVIVLMAAYNEEQVIQEKLDTLQALDYPEDKIKIYIGSDNSSDRTNLIVSAYAKKDPRIHFFPYKDRNGKPKIINRLVAEIRTKRGLHKDLIFLMTDASVMLRPDTLKKLVRHLRDPEIALVDTNMQSMGIQKAGVSKSEQHYVSGEVLLKHHESILWKKMIGPFGGCYLIRSNFYHEVPPNYLVDDFYIAFKAFEDGGGAINDLEAICYEPVSGEMSEEYRRKSRIGAGNFQNLMSFKHFLLPPKDALGFAFFSHKVLRWKGPFFIIFAFFSSGILAYNGNQFYLALFIVQILLWLILPLLDYLLRFAGVHIGILRNIRYFIYMNIALLHGFFKYINGIKTNVWQPTKRA